MKTAKIVWCVSSIYIIVAVLTACQSNQKPSIEIPEGMVGLIGYGSLTSKEQMASQLGKPYNGNVEIIHLEGYQRTWTATTPNELEFPPIKNLLKCLYEGDSIFPKKLSVLNIHENDSIAINCCFFIIDEKDLEPIDKTEKGYKRIEVTDRIREFNVSKGKVWAYKAMADYTEIPKPDSPYDYALPKMYLEFLEAGFSELGENYRKEFYETTIPIPQSVVLNCFMVSADSMKVN